MVLGFGSKSAKKKGKGQYEQPGIRSSPSLPELSAQGIPWPENLVDVAAIRQTPPPDHPAQGAAKTSFQLPSNTTIPFHRPFRVAPGSPGKLETTDGGPISSLYMSRPPSAFANHQRAGTFPSSVSASASMPGRQSQRRARTAPTFNLMVAGAQGIGKTSLLRLLVDTADISPTATAEQRAAMDRFLRGSDKRTQRIDSASVEICESRFERVVLSIIDTPGLDVYGGNELKLERQVSSIVKYIDKQYAETMGEEFKVVRKSKGDQHVHLCIYLVDPESVVPASVRTVKSAFVPRNRSEVTIRNRTPERTSIAGNGPTDDGHSQNGTADHGPHEDTDDEATSESEALTMAPGDLHVIRRLSARVNVLPVIARSDSLTDEKLSAVKEAMQRDLIDAGVGFGVFGPAKPRAGRAKKRSNGSNGNGHIDEGIGSDEDLDEEEERQSRPVIKLRPNSRVPNRSSSRSRVDISEARDDSVPLLPEATDPESLASVRFSARIIGKQAALEDLLPFALVMPEQMRNRRALKQAPPSRPDSRYSEDTSGGSVPAASEDGHESVAPSVHAAGARSIAQSVRSVPYVQGPPRDLRGVFVRRFRWGTVDVLDPAHCDFAALRTAVLSTHMKVLKRNTKEVLYEKFRTEKLLARRATQTITDDDRERLLESSRWTKTDFSKLQQIEL